MWLTKAFILHYYICRSYEDRLIVTVSIKDVPFPDILHEIAYYDLLSSLRYTYRSALEMTIEEPSNKYYKKHACKIVFLSIN